METESHYELLEVARSADDETIRAAVREQRRRWTQLQNHPDLDTSHQAARRVRAISEAERILTDPALRRAYDETLPKAMVPDEVVPARAAPSASPVPPPPPPPPLPDAVPKPSPARTNVPTPVAAGDRSWESLLAWVTSHKPIVAGAAGVFIVLVIIIASASSNSSSRSSYVQPAANVQPAAPVSSTPIAPQATLTPTATAGAAGSLVTSVGSPTFEDGALWEDSSLFLPAIGFVDVDVDTLLPAESVQSYQMAQVGTGADARIAVQVELFHAAVDLTPESYEQRLLIVDPTSKAVEKSVVLSSSATQTSLGSLHGSPTDVVVISSESNDSTPASTAAFSASTGAPLWTHSGTVERVSGTVALLEASVASSDNRTCGEVHAVGLASGQDVWSVTKDILDDPSGYCGGIGLSSQALSTGNSGSAESDRYVAVDFGDTGGVFDIASGARPAWRDGDSITTGLVDPVTGFVFSPSRSGSSGGTAAPALVYDPATSTSYFSLPADQASSLDLQVTAFYDGKLYVSTTADKLVLDARTGATVSRDWTAYPLGDTAGYIVFSDGHLEKKKA